jgi:hypothetical protein
MSVRSLLVLAGLASACGHGDSSPPPRHDDAQRPRRIIQPPAGVVRPMPPYAIRGDGVGPYRLGAPLGAILASLPSGPRVAMLDIPGVAEYSVVRAEDGAVHIGGENMGEARYVAVLGPEIARTEGGVAVGSSRADVDAAMGAKLEGRTWARDARLGAYASLPGVRFVFESGRVVAVLLTQTPGAPPAAAGDAGAGHEHEPVIVAPACSLAVPRDRDAILASAGAVGRNADVVPACLGGIADALVVGHDSVVAVLGDGERVRRLASIDLPGVLFAAPVTGEGERDEIAVVTEKSDDRGRSITVTVLRLEGGKPIKLADDEVYTLRSERGWALGDLAELDLLIELHAGPDSIVVGGAVARHANGGVVDLAPLAPVVVSRRRRIPGIEASTDAGVPMDGGSRPGDAAAIIPDGAP